jgi:hypothetical protein
MEKTCGTCTNWQPEKRTQKSGATYRTTDPLCTMTGKVRYAEDKPVSWCYKEASREQLASRVKAGLIKEG